MVNSNPEMPSITSEQRQKLLAAKPHLDQARTVLNTLEEIGVDVATERTSLENLERVREGLLTKFSPAPRRRS